MSTLQRFQFQTKDVRTVILNNVIWFVIADICRVLGITNPTMAAKSLAADDLSTTEVIDSMGRRQTVRITTEGGLYKLIFQSRKAEAEEFQRWITHEVIPSIRTTGGYRSTAIQQESDDLVLARGYGIAMQRLTEAQEQLAIAAPKVAAFNTFLGADNDYDCKDAAALLSNELGIKVGRNQLFEWLREQGWISPIDDRPYQRYLNNDWLGLKVSTYRVRRTDGTTTLADPQLRITPKGLARILKVMTKQAASPAPAPALTARSSKRRSLNP